MLRTRTSGVHAATRRIDVTAGLAVLCVAAGTILAAVDDAAPTQSESVDVVWRAVSGALIVAAGAFAPPVYLVASGVLAAVSSGSPLLITLGALACIVGVAAAVRWPDVELLGAIVGLLVATVAFRLPHDEPLGLSTLIAIVVVLPLMVGAWQWGPDQLVRGVAALAGLVLLVGVAAGVGFAVSAVQAQSSLDDAATELDLAVELFGLGDEDGARSSIEAAGRSIADARDVATRSWLAPLRIIPVLAQHERLLDTLTDEAQRTVSAGDRVLDDLDRTSLTIGGGRVDLDAVESVRPGIDELAAATARAERELDAADSPWLVGPARSGLDETLERLADVVDATDRAADVLALAPSAFGRDAPAHHLVLFATPAELRGSIGLIGNWALIEADDGRLSLQGVGRASDLNDALERTPVALREPEGYLERYGANAIETEFQDVSLSPHFPDVASVAAQLFEAAEGVPIDQVLMVDPFGVAALLRLTGPIGVLGTTLTTDNVAEFLLVDQYSTFATEEARVEFLGVLLSRTFSRLLEVDFPAPWELDDIFAEVVDQDRLLLGATSGPDVALLDDLGLSGTFRPPDSGSDFVALILQNAGQNKADTFLHRSMRYEVELDAGTGALEASATVELTNTIPDLSLPEPIIENNDQGYPLGSNIVEVTIYSPHRLTGVVRDGAEIAAQSRTEFGVRTYSVLLEIAAGATTTLRFALAGEIVVPDGGLDTYELEIPVQPAVRPLLLDVSLAERSDARISGADGPWRLAVPTDVDQSFRLDLAVVAG
ncbi:MAG: DUF4012 domain-containing protein [Actinomycetota bacterium]